MRNKIFLALILVLFLGSSGMIGLSLVFAQEKAGQHSGKAVYFCPMHPQITSDRKGSCPICGMDLVKKEEGADVAAVPEKKERKILFYRNPMNPAVTSPAPAKPPKRLPTLANLFP